jgi:hypothetical protein
MARLSRDASGELCHRIRYDHDLPTGALHVQPERP